MSLTEYSTRISIEGLHGIDRGETALKARADEKRREPQKALVSAKTGEGSGAIRFEPTLQRTGAGKLDRSLLSRATELLDGVENAEAEERSLAVESLRCVACELWVSAASASQYHQSLLALIEGFLLGHEDIDSGQAAALRGAVKDLASSSLNENYIDVLRSRFVDQGYNPMSILGAMETDNDGNGRSND